MSLAEPLIEEALRNPKVRDLYDEIRAHKPIQFLFEQKDTWGSKSTEDSIEITVTPTAWPASALAHELLHAKLKQAGYIQYVTVASMDGDPESLMGVITALDNELQHHRIFGDFVSLGFEPARFYHDDDSQALASIRKELKELDPRAGAARFLLKYLTVIAPGGVGDQEERRKARSFLKSQAGWKIWSTLQKIENEIGDWAKAGTYDASQYIRNILKLLGYDRTWFGVAPADFPENGYFVGATFTELDVEAHIANSQQTG